MYSELGVIFLIVVPVSRFPVMNIRLHFSFFALFLPGEEWLAKCIIRFLYKEKNNISVLLLYFVSLPPPSFLLPAPYLLRITVPVKEDGTREIRSRYGARRRRVGKRKVGGQME